MSGPEGLIEVLPASVVLFQHYGWELCQEQQISSVVAAAGLAVAAAVAVVAAVVLCAFVSFPLQAENNFS